MEKKSGTSTNSVMESWPEQADLIALVDRLYDIGDKAAHLIMSMMVDRIHNEQDPE